MSYQETEGLGCALRRVLFTAALVLSGCDLGMGDDPWFRLQEDPCLASNARTDDGACVVPVRHIEIDGQAEDWLEVEELFIGSACQGPCPEGAPVSLQLARSTYEEDRASLVFRVRLAGGAAPALLREDRRYFVELRAVPEYPSPTSHTLIVSPLGVRYRIGQNEVFPRHDGQPEIVASWTDDGFEASVSQRLIPFDSGTEVTVSLVEGEGESQRFFPETALVQRACWDADDTVTDPCRGSLSP